MLEPLYALWHRVRSRFQRESLDSELAEELKLHAELLREEAERNGATLDQATRAASLRLGNLTNIREATRDRWSWGWGEAFMQDAKYALRFLLKSPGFTAVAIVSIALGIGANTTVFSVADKLWFSAPAHIDDPDHVLVVNIKRDYGEQQKPFFTSMTSFREYFALKEHAQSFESIALSTQPTRQRLGRGPLVPRIKESLVTSNFFDVLGTSPFRGRFFLASDDDPGQSVHAAVISYGFWKRQFGGADSAIGAQFSSTDVRFVVVGIAPENFTGAIMDAVDVWAPLLGTAPERSGQRWKEGGGGWPQVVVRLQAGVSSRAAELEASAIVQRLPDEEGMMPTKESVALGSIISARGPGDQAPAVKVSSRLILASLLVLFAACANLANLLLVRALTRRREIALRLAIGVTRPRLASQMLIESLMIAMAGSFVAFLAAYWSGTALRKLVFPDLQWGSSATSPRVLIFSMLCGTAVAAIATIAPAIRMTRADVGVALRSAAPQLTLSTGRLRQGLLVLQVALSILLIVGASAFSKSLNQAYSFDMGIDVDRLVTATMSFDSDSLSPTSILETFEEAARRIRALPGVERVNVADMLPLAGWTNFALPYADRELPPRTYATFWQLTPELQHTIGLRLVRGRWIDSSDVAPGTVPVYLISETGAQRLWPGVDPIGKCLKFKPEFPCGRILGVVRDLRPRSMHDTANIALIGGTQKTNIRKGFDGYIVIRLKDPKLQSQVIGSTRKILLDLRNDISRIDVKPIAQALESDYRPLRMGAYTFGGFALLALMLAAIGLYGILSFSVAQRTSEFGIRSALGARAEQLVVSVIREGMTVVGVGIVAGLALSWYASTAISAFLFQTGARDPSSYAVAAITLAVVALVASFVPASRVAHVDPATALRAE